MSNEDPQQPRRRNGEPVDAGDDVILSEATAAPGRQEPIPTASLTPHDLATPYVLDALTPEEREAYEEHLAGCESCQAQVAELRDVAGLLPDALVAPPADLPDAFPYLLRDVAHETLPFTAPEPEVEDQAPSSGAAESDAAAGFTPAEREPDPDEPFDDDEPLPEGDRDVPADALPDDEIDEAEEIEAIEEPEEPVPAPPVRQPRPPGRIRPGVRPAAVGAATADAPAPRAARPGLRASPATIALAALGVIAIGLFLWALLLQGRVNDLESEVDAQQAELANLRQQANATSYTLLPTADGPEGASGLFFFSLPEQRGALTVTGLDPLPEGQVYQLWYIDDDEAANVSGPTFEVDANGEAVVPLNASVVTFDAVALSLEPVDGSDAPTTPFLLLGRLGGAAG